MTGPVFLGRHPHHSPEWFLARRGGIGSSDIGAILGLSKWASPYSVWADKMSDDLTPDEGNRFTEWGTRLEEVIASKFADEHPEYTVTTTGTWHGEGRDWQRANPDRLLEVDTRDGWEIRALLEIKTASRDYDWVDGVPPLYRAQCLWQADVMGLDTVFVAVLVGGNQYAEYRLDFTEEERLALRHAGQAWWERHVLGFEPPALDGSDATLQAVWDLTPAFKPDVPPVVLPDDLVEEYRALKATEKATAEALKQVQSLILIHLGEAKQAVDSAGQAVVARQEYIEQRIDTKALRDLFPDVAAAVTRDNPVRKLVKAR